MYWVLKIVDSVTKEKNWIVDTRLWRTIEIEYRTVKWLGWIWFVIFGVVGIEYGIGKVIEILSKLEKKFRIRRNIGRRRVIRKWWVWYWQVERDYWRLEKWYRFVE